MTKYESLRAMVLSDVNHHRRELGLGPVSAAQMECSSPGEPAKAPEQRFDGTQPNPLPLGQDVELMGFRALVNWADKLGVSHDEGHWLDDEWPDKEDELRVAVAEAMGKVGK